MFPTLRPIESIEPAEPTAASVVEETTDVIEAPPVEAPPPARRRRSFPGLRQPAAPRASHGRTPAGVTGLHLEQSEAIAVVARAETGEPIVQRAAAADLPLGAV